MTSLIDVAAWRSSQRRELLNQRTALDKETLSRWQFAMDQRLERGFPFTITPGAVIAICWPHRNEYDLRALAARWRSAGATIALPVVMEKAAPLVFRAWDNDTVMAAGPQGIPHPEDGPALIPNVVLAPAVGYDLQGFRLGYGGGYFDRTLAALADKGQRPLTIATAYEMCKLDSVYPQPHDVPMDYVLTEAGLYRRDQETLALLDPD